MNRRMFIIALTATMGGLSLANAQQRKLVVGVEAANKPFIYAQDGKYGGFSYDLWVEIAKDLNITYDLQAMDFSAPTTWRGPVSWFPQTAKSVRSTISPVNGWHP